MRIEWQPSFKRAYKKRIANNPKLAGQVASRIKLFLENPSSSVLKDHPLKGKKLGLRAFSITGDIRIVYFPVSKDWVFFLDIGSHNQVY